MIDHSAAVIYANHGGCGFPADVSVSNHKIQDKRKNIKKDRYNVYRSDNIVDEHHIEIIRNMEGVLFASKNESKKYKQPIR